MENELYKNLASRLDYLNDCDMALIKKAFYFAFKCHEGQFRLSGDEFITHPVAVAEYLANKKYSVDIIASALLHDVLEECNTKPEQIKDQFGPNIFKIVQSVTSISKIPLSDKSLIFSDEEMYLERVEEYRKLLVAMAREIRVIVVKLADRLHNIQTIKYLQAQKRPFYARETIEIYAQIADRLGLGDIKLELEDLSFPYAYTKEYQEYKRLIKKSKSINPAFIDRKIDELRSTLSRYKIKYVDIYGRVKHDFSLYRKLIHEKNYDLTSIYDLYALRIIADSIESCYQTLGIIHALYTPLPGRIFDYIAEPKASGYQSLHTTVRDQNGHIFEIQIRTTEMHRVAESGIAAHWRYKTSINQKSTDRLKRSFDEWSEEVEKLNRIKNKKKILSYLKEDLFADKIFVFTPQREIIKLPKGATPVDFAFRIHSSLGLHLSGAKINGRLTTIEKRLENGDEVEILTKNSAVPSINWLSFCKTPSAKQKIRQYLRFKNSDKYIYLGQQIFNQFLTKHNLKLPTAKSVADSISNSRLPYKSYNDALIGVAEKALPPHLLAKIIFPSFSLTEKKTIISKKSAAQNNKLSGVRNIYAGCCKPKKSDKLLAYVGQDHLIKIHKSNCGMIKNVNPERIIEL